MLVSFPAVQRHGEARHELLTVRCRTGDYYEFNDWSDAVYCLIAAWLRKSGALGDTHDAKSNNEWEAKIGRCPSG